mmetsp:Transcript_79296/g.181753  ORF Transcript_79296/g.181753 Transcript_79296/m.181753 type:complete len:586 (+) Transcript_79296:75-1832(+)
MRVLLAVLVQAVVAAEHTWVPIRLAHGLKYFNPETDAVMDQVPTGDRVAPVVAFPGSAHTLQFAQEPESLGVDATPEEADIPVAQTQAEAIHAVTAVTSTEVVEGEAKSCYPRCTWNCTQPICNQDCTPECEQPTCQTRCPRPDYSACKIDCGEPHCSVFCPKDLCRSTPGAKCSSPKCSTQCARPVCALKCKNRVPCNNVCHPPRCTWNCRNPRACAKPECRLVCERPLGCAQNYELPPLSPALTVEASFNADRAKWVVYPWGPCGTMCGKAFQTRKVLCSTGDDHECAFSPKPPTQQSCEDVSGCNVYHVSEWSKCSMTCGKGIQTRSVTCSNEDEKECLDKKPESEQDCMDKGDHCTGCRVVLFGNGDFTGWNATFGPGNYETDDLVDGGAKCEEVSSAKVIGECCHAYLYQYGDFNRRNKGWRVHLAKGEYDDAAMEEAGVQDNDASALRVEEDSSCALSSRTKVRQYHRTRRTESQNIEEETEKPEEKDALNGMVERLGSSKDEAKAENEDSSSDKDKEAKKGKTGKKGKDAKSKEAAGSNEVGSGPTSGYTWWFWILLGALVLAVVAGVVVASRRRAAA